VDVFLFCDFRGRPQRRTPKTPELVGSVGYVDVVDVVFLIESPIGKKKKRKFFSSLYAPPYTKTPSTTST
jgi:hypothetical protein